MTRKRCGYTLVEMLVAIGVLAIAAAAAVTYISSASTGAAVSNATQTMAADLLFAQNRAIASHQKVYVVFTPGSGNNPDKYELQSPLGTSLSRPIHNTGPVTMGKAQAKNPGAKLGLGSTLTIGFDASGQPFTRSSSGTESYITAPQDIAIRGVAKDLSTTVSVKPFTGEITAK